MIRMNDVAFWNKSLFIISIFKLWPNSTYRHLLHACSASISWRATIQSAIITSMTSRSAWLPWCWLNSLNPKHHFIQSVAFSLCAFLLPVISFHRENVHCDLYFYLYGILYAPVLVTPQVLLPYVIGLSSLLAYIFSTAFSSLIERQRSNSVVYAYMEWTMYKRETDVHHALWTLSSLIIRMCPFKFSTAYFQTRKWTIFVASAVTWYRYDLPIGRHVRAVPAGRLGRHRARLVRVWVSRRRWSTCQLHVDRETRSDVWRHRGIRMHESFLNQLYSGIIVILTLFS